MKTKLNRLYALLLVLSMALSMALSMGLMAYAHDVPDLNKKGSIAITTQKDGKPVAGGTLTIYRVAEVVENDGNYQFSLVGDFEDCGKILVLQGSAADIALRLKDYAALHGVKGMTTQTVSQQGTASFNNLPLGLYLIVQNKAAPGYTAVAPFLISMPYMENGVYQYDLSALPKTKPEAGDLPPPASQPGTTEPKPTDPDPTTPDPTRPDPTDPDPTRPDPTDPDPTRPDPTTPDPTRPDPTDPDPTRPDPTEPDPTRPTRPDPTEPDPTRPTRPTRPERDPDPTEPDPTRPTRPERDPDEPPTEPWLEDIFDPDTPLDGRDPEPETPEIPVDPDEVLFDIEEPLLPLTGQLWWPVPVLAVAGMTFFTAGWLLFSNKEKKHER